MQAAGAAGSIPANAGEPGSSANRLYTDWVYPRERGGTNCRNMRVACVPGLSPRTRGNRCTVPLAAAKTRSIPANAGEPLAGAVESSE